MTPEEIKTYCRNKRKVTEELLNMIDQAYDIVFSKFSKKGQKKILEEFNEKTI